MSKTAANTPRLSLCMIVRNARELLPDCLASVHSLVDDWVFVDTGSTDGTRAYLRQTLPQATLLEALWEDHFAKARNRSLEAAQGEWILVLDADERLSPESLPLLKRLLQAPPSDVDAFDLLRENLDTQGAVFGWDFLCRLFRRSAGLRYLGRIHERFDLSEYNQPDKACLKKQTLGQLRIRHLADSEAVSQQKEAYYLHLLNLARREEPCPYMDFHWAILPTIIQTVPAAERQQLLQQALQESLHPPDPRPHSAWESAPIEATILEIEHLMVEQGHPAELCTWFESLSTPSRVAESWGHYALACSETRPNLSPQAQRRSQHKIYRAWLHCLDPAYPASDPGQGWDSWRALAFLAQFLLEAGDPPAAACTALQGLLWAPPPRFESDLWQILNRALQGLGLAGPGGLFAMFSGLKRSFFRAVQAQDSHAVLQLAALILPLRIDREVLMQSILAAHRLMSAELTGLLGLMGQLLWPEQALFAEARRLMPQHWGQQGEVPEPLPVPESSRLLQAFLPRQFAPPLVLNWQSPGLPTPELEARAELNSVPKAQQSAWLLEFSGAVPSPQQVQRLLTLIALPAARAQVWHWQSETQGCTLWPTALLKLRPHLPPALFQPTEISL